MRLLHAQTWTSGRIEGRVLGASESSLNTAVVSLIDRTSSVATNGEVGRDGAFTFTFVAPGEYDVTIEAFGARPLTIERVVVYAGEITRLAERLSPSGDVSAPREVRRYSGTRHNSAFSFGPELIARFPDAARQIRSLAHLSSFSDASLETEGLPSYLSGTRIDGLPIGSPTMRGDATAAAMPISGVRLAEIDLGADVESSGTAAPAISAFTTAATARFQVNTFADWTTGPAQRSELSSPLTSGIRAGALLSGPISSDTSGFVVGLEMWRMETPIAYSARFDSIAANVYDIAQSRFGVSSSQPLSRLANTNAVSGFTKVEWNIRQQHTFTLNGAFTTLPKASAVPGLSDWIGSRSDIQGTDAFAAATLRSQLGTMAGQEFRVALDRNDRDYAAGPNGGIENVSTFFVQDGLAIGRNPGLAGRFTTTTFRLRETLHFWGGAHHAKAGVTGDLASHQQTILPTRSASFWFSNTADFASTRGYAFQTNGALSASFTMPQVGAFVQDEWLIGTGFKLLIGARWDAEKPPLSKLTVNEDFLRLSGLRVDSGLTRHGRISPRIEFDWRPDAAQRWALRGSYGQWSVAMDPVLFGELIANHGDVRVSRGFGNYANWPQPNSSVEARSLTLVAPGFQGPLSKRATVQLSHVVSPGVQIDLAGTFRRTELLPIRTDLNRIAAPIAQDQYGRDLFGSLQKQASLLAPVTGSNRRFPDFDIVSAIGVDGWSEYKGGTASLQAQLSSVFLHAAYSYSQTRDNWFMARESSPVPALSPFSSTGSLAPWTEGTSDFDVPHRAVVGADLTFPIRNLRIGALYRYRSGYSFTPGFRDGVDANGDGSPRNDPAFVDDQIPQFGEVAAKWPCLQQQIGHFAARNSCRGPAAHSLDARVAITLFGNATNSTDLIFEALDLASSGGEELDRALYLVDATRNLTVNPLGTIVTVPLVTNPHFGAPFLRTATSRALRVGLRVRY